MKDMLSAVTVKRVIDPDEEAGDNTAVVGQIIDHQGYESATYVKTAEDGRRSVEVAFVKKRSGKWGTFSARIRQ